MSKKLISYFTFIFFLTFSVGVFAQTKTVWEQNNGEELISWDYEAPYHGWDGEYDLATIPPEDDPNWLPLTDSEEDINYSQIPSSLCDANIPCLTGGQFTYFRTYVDIPADIDVYEFKISAEVVIDGIRVTVFNSAHPDGSHIAYMRLGERITGNLKDSVISGEVNTIVITHLDDCCYSSFLNDVDISLNGQIVYSCSPPVVLTRDMTVMLNSSGEVSINAAEIDAGSTSECGIADMNVSPNYFSCNFLGQRTVTLTVTDTKGNTASGEANVMVVDNAPPAVDNCPGNIVIDNEPGACGASINWNPPSFTDNCGIVNVTSNYNPDSFFPAECANSASGTVVTYTAVDNSNNETTCSFTVTVLDKEAPVVSNCPADITVNNDPGECGAAVAWIPPSFTDNCNLASVTGTHNPGDFFSPANCAGSADGTVVTYTAVDDCGNVTKCSFTVIVLDTEAPVVSNCPADITVNNDPGECGAVVTWTPPVFTDNCNVSNVTGTHNPGDFFSPAECADSAVGTVVTYTAVDDCGNETTCSFTVTVLDMEAPVPAITEVDGNYDGLRLAGDYGYWDGNAIVFRNTDDIIVHYDVVDNCDPNPAIDFKVEWEGEDKSDVGVLDTGDKTITIDPYELVGNLKVTVISTDYCGNSSSVATDFSIILYIPEGKMIVKPENFCVNPGKFTNFVKFPEPYDVYTLTDARSDGAPQVNINICNVCEDEEICEECENWDIKAVLKFNRDEIPEVLVDKFFVLRGVFEYNGKTVYFQGSDEVKFDCQQEEKPNKPKPPKFTLFPILPTQPFYPTQYPFYPTVNPFDTSFNKYQGWLKPNFPGVGPQNYSWPNMGITNAYSWTRRY